MEEKKVTDIACAKCPSPSLSYVALLSCGKRMGHWHVNTQQCTSSYLPQKETNL